MNIKSKYSKEIEESLKEIDKRINLIRKQSFIERNSIYGMYATNVPTNETIKKSIDFQNERLKPLYELRNRIIEENNPKLIVELEKGV